MLSRFRYSFPPEGIGAPTSSWRMPAPLIIAALQGTNAETLWFDAAMLYRGWVLANANWTRRGPLSARDEFTNGRWGELDWWMHSEVTFSLPDIVDPPDILADSVLALCSMLDACESLAFNYYGWNQVQFDTRYPNMFPAQPTFKQATQRMQKAGVQVVPYTNGILWDTGNDNRCPVGPWRTHRLNISCSHECPDECLQCNGSCPHGPQAARATAAWAAGDVEREAAIHV